MFRKYFKRLVSRLYEKTALNGLFYDFSVDYDAIAVNDILDICNYWMKKYDIV